MRMAEAFRYAVRLALKPVGLVLLGLIKSYQYLISPMFPPTCRFLPTCSQFANEALRVHGPVRGGWLALWRIARCNPWGGHGYDPVPGIACKGHDHSPDAPAPLPATPGQATPGDRRRPTKIKPGGRRRPIQGTS